MDAATLAALEHQNLIEAELSVASQVPGARADRADGVVLVATGLPLRLCNQVLIEGASAGSAAIGAAVAVLRARQTHFAVNLRDGFDDGHVPAMAALGLVPLPGSPWMPGMAMHPLPDPGSLPPASGNEIVKVTDAAGVADHIRAGAAGFGMPETWLEALVTEQLARRSDTTLYVGYTEGVAVTTGLGIRTGRTIGVYNIATVESARRRGYGAAMTMRVVDDGATIGCDVAILQASDMGYPIYERLGFKTVVEYFAYVDPESLATPALVSPSGGPAV